MRQVLPECCRRFKTLCNMQVKDFLKSGACLLLASALVCNFVGCSDDEGPALLEGITVTNAGFDLDESGNATLEFTVTPENAQVDEVELTPANVFEVTGLTSVGGGVWQVAIRATNLSLVAATQSVMLSASQNGVPLATADVTINDPYTLDGLYEVAYPATYSYAIAGRGSANRLPVVVTSDDASAMSQFLGINWDLDESQSDFNDDDFVTETSSGGTSTSFLLTPDVLIQLEGNQQALSLEGDFLLEGMQGRRARVPFSLHACPPEVLSSREGFSVSAADLGNPDFSRAEVVDDIAGALNRVGLYNGSGVAYDYETVEVSNLGLFDEEGNEVSGADFFSAELIWDYNGAPAMMASFRGTSATVPTGVYYYVIHIVDNWNYNNQTYPRINANLRIPVNVQ